MAYDLEWRYQVTCSGLCTEIADLHVVTKRELAHFLTATDVYFKVSLHSLLAFSRSSEGYVIRESSRSLLQ